MGATLFGAYQFGESVKDAQWHRWNDRDTADANARVTAEADACALEQQRQQSAEKVQRDTTQKLEQARTDAAGANAADWLRQRVQEFLHAASSARGNPGSSGSCTPGPNPGDLLAVVLDKSVQRNRELAAIADTARVRGACL
ncbi:DUF2514 family protein [Pseudomonas gingeri]|nr:DUF2514 family protein [Pseudomonas gingeri]